jgi:hypothetical protein
VNTHLAYRRHNHRPSEQPVATTGTAEELNQLALRGDPSLRRPLAAANPDRSKRIAWVRPTELPSFASPVVGRGIDLQAELIRRARRTPATTSRSGRRTVDNSLRTREPQAPHQEGLHL